MAYQPRSRELLKGGRGWLTKESAASIHRIDKQIGHRLQITEAGRTWAEQNVHYQRYLRYGSPIALNPDTPSVHQKGDAIDSDEAQNILAVMTDHGWIRTVYRWVNGKWTLIERWHFEHFIERDNHRYEGDPSGGSVVPKPTPTEEVISMATEVIVTEKDRNNKPLADKDRRMAYVNTESGFNVDFSWLSLKDADAAAAKVGMPKGAIRMSDTGFDKWITRLNGIPS